MFSWKENSTIIRTYSFLQPNNCLSFFGTESRLLSDHFNRCKLTFFSSRCNYEISFDTVSLSVSSSGKSPAMFTDTRRTSLETTSLASDFTMMYWQSCDSDSATVSNWISLDKQQRVRWLWIMDHIGPSRRRWGGVETITVTNSPWKVWCPVVSADSCWNKSFNWTAVFS